MPYSSTSDLPGHIKDRLSPEKQKQWLAAFNSIYERTKSEGRAFAGANSAVKKGLGYENTRVSATFRDNLHRRPSLTAPMRTEKASPTASSVHVPNAEDKLRARKESDGYVPPKSAQNAAKRVLRWKDLYGDEVNGMTSVGWNRARELAAGGAISLETVKRMAQFSRHKKNSKIDPEHRGKPWKDAGHVAWQGWGGDSGITWAKRISDRETSKSMEKRQLGDDQFTTVQEARAASHNFGMNGTAHVFDTEDGAFYMPGESHEEYLEAKARMAGIEPDDDEEAPDVDDRLERTVRTIMETLMSKSFTIHADVVKAEQQIAYGWASVVSVDGENLIDRQGHIITSAEMEKMANAFMMSQRVAKEMHTGESVGEVIHSMPITSQLMKALGGESKIEGWLIGVKINDPDVWKRVKDGTLKAFSIGGKGKLTNLEEE